MEKKMRDTTADAAIDNLIDWTRVAGASEAASASTRLSALCEHYRRRAAPIHHFDLPHRAPGVALLLRLHPGAEARLVAEGDAVMRDRRIDEPRHYWLRPLVYAYLLTGDERYVSTGLDLIEQWRATSPDYNDPHRRKLRFGGLTAARRGMILQYFFCATRDAEAWTDERMLRYLGYVWETAVSLEDHNPLGWHNIHFSVLVTRHAFSLCFPEFKASAEWLDSGLEGIVRCAGLHRREDGSNLEQSPNYHRVVMSGLTTVALLRRINGLTTPKVVLDNIDAMSRYLDALRTPRRNLPPLGDSKMIFDTGNLLFYTSLVRDDVRFRDARPSPEQCLYLPTPDALAALERPETPPPPKDTPFPGAGYYAMRSSWNADATYLVFDAGPHGFFHGHLDLFSIHLMRGERSLVVDPGSSYTSDPCAAAIRSTPFHNTVSLDGLSHRIYEDQDEPLAHVTQWETRPDGSVLLSARHTAYDHLWGRPEIQRQIFFDGDGLFVVVDRVVCVTVDAGIRPHALVANFTFPDAAHVADDPPARRAHTTFPDGPNLCVQCVNAPDIHIGGLAEGSIAEEGGFLPTKRFVLCRNGDRTWLATVLRVTDGEAAPLSATATGDATGTIRVEFEKGGPRLAFEPNRIVAR